MLSFPAGERVEKLRRYMADQGVDICLLSSPENMEYFSRISGYHLYQAHIALLCQRQRHI